MGMLSVSNGEVFCSSHERFNDRDGGCCGGVVTVEAATGQTGILVQWPDSQVLGLKTNSMIKDAKKRAVK